MIFQRDSDPCAAKSLYAHQSGKLFSLEQSFCITHLMSTCNSLNLPLCSAKKCWQNLPTLSKVDLQPSQTHRKVGVYCNSTKLLRWSIEASNVILVPRITGLYIRAVTTYLGWAFFGLTKLRAKTASVLNSTILTLASSSSFSVFLRVSVVLVS